MPTQQGKPKTHERQSSNLKRRLRQDQMINPIAEEKAFFTAIEE
jgi:hypothetical protein